MSSLSINLNIGLGLWIKMHCLSIWDGVAMVCGVGGCSVFWKDLMCLGFQCKIGSYKRRVVINSLYLPWYGNKSYSRDGEWLKMVENDCELIELLIWVNRVNVNYMTQSNEL